ncbi:MAG TPA: GTPase domain-containing protein [Thermoanaerobaculia bacterium]|jgi:signal recognition particle receptor subunit beta|nr:GTPase domain-containing protein [Thermoanaerobaculia bacterium]
MVLFNHATREMTAKIVYYGPGLCGKTTNLMVIFDKLDPKSKGKMLSLATKTDRTLFFDLLPVDIGKVGSFNLKIQLYTVPGQVFYNETRKLVLRGADSIVFVADSQPSMVESTRESFANLLDNMAENQIDANDTPIVIQFNKRDIPGVLPVEELQTLLGFEGYPYTEASAIKGEGVMETFKLVSKITAKHLFNRLKGPRPEVPKVRPASSKIAVKQSPEPEPFAEAAPPFPESAPIDAGYEKMEEVSLEQLLGEGRERPVTLSGNVPVPEHDEVEELAAEALIPHEEPAVAVLDEPEPAVVEVLAEAIPEPEPIPLPEDPRVPELEGELEAARKQLQDAQQQLAAAQQQLQEAREQQRGELELVLRDLGLLSDRVRSRLGE